MNGANAGIFSLLVFYYRITNGARIGWFKNLLHFTTAFNLISWAVFTILAIIPC